MKFFSELLIRIKPSCPAGGLTQTNYENRAAEGNFESYFCAKEF
jgi:hypothetical protein